MIKRRNTFSRKHSSIRSRGHGAASMDDRGWTLLHIGCRKGDLKEVKRLLDEGILDVNVATCGGHKSRGVNPLHLAAKGGHVEVMDELLHRGANRDARTNRLGGACGWTPLHNAAKERRREAVKFLVENGAFLPDDMHDCRFNPPLHYCHGLEWAYDRGDEAASATNLIVREKLLHAHLKPDAALIC